MLAPSPDETCSRHTFQIPCLLNSSKNSGVAGCSAAASFSKVISFVRAFSRFAGSVSKGRIVSFRSMRKLENATVVPRTLLNSRKNSTYHLAYVQSQKRRVQMKDRRGRGPVVLERQYERRCASVLGAQAERKHARLEEYELQPF